MTTLIYPVRRQTPNGSGADFWFWDRDEAERQYEKLAEMYPTNTVTMYAIDASDIIGLLVPSILDGDNGGDIEFNELRSNRKPELAAEVETLRSMLSTALSTLEHDQNRLDEYRDDFNADPAEDTAAQIKRTERKIEAGRARIKALEFAVNALG